MSTDLPLVAPAQAEAALHGSYCPKMCTFACPVTAATGRDDAVPWSFHRALTDLADGRLPPSPEAAARLTACTGCLGCRVPCLFEQDVPAQVRAGRAVLHAAGAADSAVAAAVARVAAGISPFGLRRDATATDPEGHPGTDPATDPAMAPGAGGHLQRRQDLLDREERGEVVVVAGCRDDVGTVAAARRLLAAGGARPVVVLPDGCCGAALRDLGAVPEADRARDAVATTIADRLSDGAGRVVTLDPHCLGELRRAVPGVEVHHVVVELHRLVEAGRLRLRDGLAAVTYHDPCLLARAERITEEPRALLRAAGAALLEPEGHGAGARCSGAGLALELLDPAAAEATAARRRPELTGPSAAHRGSEPAAPTTPEPVAGSAVVTACSGARRRLAADGTAVADLVQLLTDHLVEDPA